MTIKEALETSGIALFDAEVLLSALLQKDRSWLLSHGDDYLEEESTWQEWVAKRQNDVPVAYITNTKEFYGRPFFVDERVLIPRPSTEGLVDLALHTLESGKEEERNVDTSVAAVSKVFGDLSEVSTIVDVCTGSGCIAITLAKEANLPLIALDISEDALDVAKKNAATLNVEDRVEFRLSDCLGAIQDLDTPFFIVSNPPYVPEDEKLHPDVRKNEPKIALFGGADGSVLVQKIYEEAKKHPYCRGIALECREEHVKKLQ